MCTHLDAFSSGGPQCPPDDLLHHIWQQTGCYQKDYAEPGRTTGQHLHEHIVHPLVVEEGPERRGEEFINFLYFPAFTFKKILTTVTIKNVFFLSLPDDSAPQQREDHEENQ